MRAPHLALFLIGLALAAAPAVEAAAGGGETACHPAPEGIVVAPTAPPPTEAPGPDFSGAVISPGAMLIRVALGLAVVMGILGSVLFLYRKATRGRPRLGRQQGIDVLTQRSLGQRTHLTVVRVAGETLLLGVTPQQVNMLARIAPTAPREAKEEEPSFARTLAGEVERVRKELWPSIGRLES